MNSPLDPFEDRLSGALKRIADSAPPGPDPGEVVAVLLHRRRRRKFVAVFCLAGICALSAAYFGTTTWSRMREPVLESDARPGAPSSAPRSDEVPAPQATGPERPGSGILVAWLASGAPFDDRRFPGSFASLSSALESGFGTCSVNARPPAPANPAVESSDSLAAGSSGAACSALAEFATDLRTCGSYRVDGIGLTPSGRGR